MPYPYRPWFALAQDAEARGDWQRAAECWYRAAEQCTDGDQRAEYNRREDAATDTWRECLRLQAEADKEKQP